MTRAAVEVEYGRSTADALTDFLEHADEVESLIEKRFATRDRFDDLAAEALMIRLGESVIRAGKRFSDDHPELHFRDIANTRNVAAHGYDVIDHRRIWRYFKVELPPIVEEVKKLIK